jgi:hypothetical protein
MSTKARLDAARDFWPYVDNRPGLTGGFGPAAVITAMVAAGLPPRSLGIGEWTGNREGKVRPPQYRLSAQLLQSQASADRHPPGYYP